jgi:hypothetical protein
MSELKIPKDMFRTTQSHQLQLSFTNFTIEQLSLRVGLTNLSFTKMKFS